MTTIREFTNPIEAGLLCSILCEHEIDASLADEYASGLGVGGPIRIQVPDEQAEEAISLLKAIDRSPAWLERVTKK